MTSDRREKLTQALMDQRVELRHKKEKRIQVYEKTFQKVIEKVCRCNSWHDVTDCDILEHLRKYKSPTETVIEIIRRLK